MGIYLFNVATNLKFLNDFLSMLFFLSFVLFWFCFGFFFFNTSYFSLSDANNPYLQCVVVYMSTTPWHLSYAMYSQILDGFCPGSSQDRVNSCGNQEGP